MNESPLQPLQPSPPENRRNHYRVLHVQPEAPLAVIQASYRTLMGRLRVHPDLGGSHAEAAMINEAWAVLSDPARRAAYDRQLRRQATRAPQPPRSASGTALALRRGDCALCGMRGPLLPAIDSRCAQCDAPLAPLPGPGSQAHELLGRRGAVRRDQDHVAMLRIGWPSPALPVRWRDLSLTGLSFYAPSAIAAGQFVYLVDSLLETVGQVVGSRAQGRLFTVHARLLTAIVLQPTGVFVSARA